MKNKDNIINKITDVRYHFNKESGEFYYSVVDIIEDLDLSNDSRNYWKVLKNRLKKRHFELVTECNQLKMRASDGKYYLTDVLNRKNILQIIQVISPDKVSIFDIFFDKIEYENGNDKDIFKQQENLNDELSTDDHEEEGEIKIDSFLKDNYIEIKMMVAGINPKDIFIKSSSKILIVSINRNIENKINSDNYFIEELFWGKLKKEINLPYEVDIDKIETNYNHGLLEIKLPILDKTRIKIIEVK